MTAALALWLLTLLLAALPLAGIVAVLVAPPRPRRAPHACQAPADGYPWTPRATPRHPVTRSRRELYGKRRELYGKRREVYGNRRLRANWRTARPSDCDSP
jgi:hypothetical protein